MHPVGVLVCVGILLLARRFPFPMVTALFASLAFGATAVISLPGGSSPMISALFVLALIAVVAMRRNFVSELAAVFREQPIAWLVVLLIAYAVVGAILLPRIFSGQTMIYMLNRDQKMLALVPLMPGGGNITQTPYFVCSALVFFALAIILRKSRVTPVIHYGVMVWAVLIVATGFIDFAGKVSGAGDILAPLRTAAYAMLTNDEAAGFFRIVGAFSEASVYGATTAALLAYMLVFWRTTNDRWALALAMALLVLLFLSTSSTAYVTAGALGLLLMLSILVRTLRDRLRKHDIFLLGLALAGFAALFAVHLYNETALDPLWRLLDAMVFDKASSASAHERGQFNLQSLENLFDTAGLGIGIGSSRASSWVIAVISQLGIIGSLLMAALTFELFRWRNLEGRTDLDLTERATVAAMRACALATVIAMSLSSGGPDPGPIFYIALATVLYGTRPAARLAREAWSPPLSDAPQGAQAQPAGAQV
jgi:hypothetical protein